MWRGSRKCPSLLQRLVHQPCPLGHYPFAAGAVVGEEGGEAEAAGHVEEALDGLADAGAGLVGAEDLDGDAVGLAADAGLQLGDAGAELVLAGGGDPEVEGGPEEGPV